MRVTVQVLEVTGVGPLFARGHLSGCHHPDPPSAERAFDCVRANNV